MKQCASLPLPAPELIRVLMDLSVPKLSVEHVSKYMSHWWSAYAAATSLRFPRPIASPNKIMETWKQLVTPLEVRPALFIRETGYERLLLAATIVGHVRAITSLAGGPHQVDDTPHLHRAWGCVPAPPVLGPKSPLRSPTAPTGRTCPYLWVLGMALGRNKDMAALTTIWARKLRLYSPFVVW